MCDFPGRSEEGPICVPPWLEAMWASAEGQKTEMILPECSILF